MRRTLLLTRQRLLFVLVALLLTIGIVLSVEAVRITCRSNGETHSLRKQYAARNGWKIDTPTAVVETVIPDDIKDPQLIKYRGCRVTVYRYPLTDREDADLDLTVYHGRVIASRMTDYHGEVYGKNQTGSVSCQSGQFVAE